MANHRVGGIIEVKVDGTVYNAKGNWTYNLGNPLRAPVIGADTVHGYKETPQVPFIEGEITDRPDISLDALTKITGATVYLRLANGKLIVLRDAWYASEGTGNTDEGNIGVRFEGISADEAS